MQWVVRLVMRAFMLSEQVEKRLFSLSRHRKSSEATPETRGHVITGPWARHYDLLVRVGARSYLGGSEQALRHMTADLARLQPGEKVLDVGCATGTLTLVAKARVGATGHVAGIDPSAQMIARARRKAERASLSVDFQPGVIEQLAFPDQSFDVVLSSMMMHQLPDDLKRQGLSEIARVLKPGGRLLVLDFKRSVHSGPWSSDIADQPALMKEAGFSAIEMGETRFQGLGFALASVSRTEDGRAAV
jgi:ubiquinone/menaquinone biosynthesis C-methylase UbiE